MPNILVVDNDANVRELVATFLRGAGHAVAFADHGAAALASIEQTRPDVVITEILLKRLDGLSLCRQIKSNLSAPGIRVIVMSILAASVRSLEAGADLFLKKPLMQHQLVDAVRSVLANSQGSVL
jgi:DNA-binding response OmpR family regulator